MSQLKSILISILLVIILLLIINPIHKNQIKDIVIKEVIVSSQSSSKAKILTVTAYSPDPGQTDSTPFQTALMEKPIPGWTCAVSRDKLGWLGGKVYIENVGVRKVNDLMNKRYKNRIDIVFPTASMANTYGKNTCQVVYLGKD